MSETAGSVPIPSRRLSRVTAIAGLTAMLRHVESEPPWRATVGLASAVLFVALVLFGMRSAAAGS